jgi:hypothetical protein
LKLLYTNPQARVQDIQVPSIQNEPLRDGAEYEVSDALGLLLLERPEWVRVVAQPAPVARRVEKNERKATKSKELVKEGE